MRYKFVGTKLEELKLGGGTFIVDDTISHHVGNHREGAGWHTTRVKESRCGGNQLVKSHYVRQLLSTPLDFRIYIKEEQAGRELQDKA